MTKVAKNYSLREMNSFGIEVFAKQFASFGDEDTLKYLLRNSEIDLGSLFVLGGGSNVLFSSNFEGTILKNDIMGIKETLHGEDEIMLSLGAGESWDEVVEYAVNKNYYGIENLSLIPGSVGAAPIQNIGAYGVELKDVLHSLEGYFIHTLEKKIFDLQECELGYRDSIFKNELKGKFIITRVNLLLTKKKKLNISYDSLNNYLIRENIGKPTLKQVRQAVIKIRNLKLPDPKSLGNAGSFFKNPKLTIEQMKNLKKKNPGIVYYPYDENYYKVAAGWLIEKCGLKGKRVGNVGTHKEQALVIVNYGKATGDEILSFAKNIQAKVSDEFGILLEPEVNIIH